MISCQSSTTFVAAALLSLVMCRAFAAEGGGRIGWEESFDDISRWEAALRKPVHGSPVKSVKGGDGAIDMITQCGALNKNMKRADWPEWPKKPASSFTNFDVRYDDTVDFDIYRYVVVRVLEKSTFSYIAMNGKGLKVLYTTGIHSQDLKPLGLTGKQKPRIYGQFLNTSGHLKLDYIRLVKELSPEEKAGFIGDGITIRKENLHGHPYHRLQALNARAGRPRRTDPPGGEWCAFRDVATGAEVWRMTNGPNDENGTTFNCDGSAFNMRGRGGRGFHVFDWTTRKFTLVEGGLSDARPRFSTVEPSVIVMAGNEWLQPRPLRRLTLYRYDFRKGEKTKMAAFETKATWRVQELSSSADSAKMVFGFRETPTVFLIDPDIEEFDKRCREITLPTRLKGVSLINKDTELRWYNCYTYQPWIMDLATEKVSHGNGPCAGGHSAGGPHYTVGPYGGLLKLLVRNGLHPQTEETADDVRLYANYKESVPTDYGRVSSNGRWVVTNGVRGDVDRQHLMMGIDDPATVLRTTMYNTSRNDWPTNTYSRSSPDCTKVAYVSDQFDDGDIYIAVTGRPAPPKELVATAARDRTVKLAWKEPDAREIAGYRVYRSSTSGFGFAALNREPLKGTSYVDREPPRGDAFYVVAMVEPSGLEGHFSNEAAVVSRRSRAPRTVFIEAETCEWKKPVREVLHGEASGTRYVRHHKAEAEEPAGGFVFADVEPPAPNARLWLRARAEGKPGSWHAHFSAGPDNALFSAEVPKGPGFRWVEAKGRGVRWQKRLSLYTEDDGLALDKIAISNDPNFDPTKSKLGAAGPVTVKPEPVTNARATYVKPNSLVVRWDASPSLNVARYDVHCGDDVDPWDPNKTIIGSTTGTTLADWGLRPGTKYTYHVIAVDSRGNEAEAVKLEATTAAAKVQTFEVTAAAAEKDPRVKVTKDAAGMEFASLPDLGDAAKDAPPAKITFPVDVAEDGSFMLWAEYAPAYVKGKGLHVGIEIDGKDSGSWRLRAPYRPMGWTLAKGGAAKRRVFSDKIVANGKDVLALAKGRHTVAIRLDPKLRASQHAVARLWATNDHSWRPPGYDPRANFAKRRK